jgi:DNA-binding response OmpR family regulator
MPQTTVVILDPDAEFAQMLAEQLGDAGITAALAADPAAAETAIAGGGVAALILASHLPDDAAIALCRRLRDSGADVTVILVGQAGDPANLLDRAGADDLLQRPIRLGTLIGRLRGLLERAGATPAESLDIGPYRFDGPAKRLIRRDTGAVTHLTEKETAILVVLTQAGEAAVPRERLLRDVWRYNPDVSTHTLETHVYRLRQKMETATAPGPFLLTEAGGYRLATDLG